MNGFSLFYNFVSFLFDKFELLDIEDVYAINRTGLVNREPRFSISKSISRTFAQNAKSMKLTET